MITKDVKRQRRFKERMYEMGFKQLVLWVKRKPDRTSKTDRDSFFGRMSKLTSGWDEASLSQLFNLLLLITESKKEVLKIRKKT